MEIKAFPEFRANIFFVSCHRDQRVCIMEIKVSQCQLVKKINVIIES